MATSLLSVLSLALSIPNPVIFFIKYLESWSPKLILLEE